MVLSSNLVLFRIDGVLGSTKSKITQDENGKIVPHL